MTIAPISDYRDYCSVKERDASAARRLNQHQEAAIQFVNKILDPDTDPRYPPTALYLRYNFRPSYEGDYFWTLRGVPKVVADALEGQGWYCHGEAEVDPETYEFTVGLRPNIKANSKPKTESPLPSAFEFAERVKQLTKDAYLMLASAHEKGVRRIRQMHPCLIHNSTARHDFMNGLLRDGFLVELSPMRYNEVEILIRSKYRRPVNASSPLLMPLTERELCGLYGDRTKQLAGESLFYRFLSHILSTTTHRCSFSLPKLDKSDVSNLKRLLDARGVDLTVLGFFFTDRRYMLRVRHAAAQPTEPQQAE
ncbi:MAG: hypothetical protein KDK78_06005 [Chlamydiia bacterium]|nr:hypothetical protein [Chlamydiia bacterium]